MGRKKIHIDWKEVDKMLRAGCTGTEVASVLCIHEDTLYNACKRDHKLGFSAYSTQKKAIGCKLLRLARFEQALEGNVAMQIWLSKQMLGETDKNGLELSGEIKLPKLVWSDDSDK